MPTFYAGQPDYIAKLNELDGKATVSLTGTSTDSLSLSVGMKSFTTDTLLQLHPTSDIKITRTSDVTKYMYGIVTTYNQDTGAMVVDIQAVNGSGTFSDWTITSSGQKGDTGDTGAKGLNAKGAWNGATAYVVDDWVTYSGSSYYRKVAGTTGTTPDVDTTNWGILAQKGDASDITAATLAASSGSSLIGYINSLTGSVATTIQAKLRRFTDILDFSTVSLADANSDSRYVPSGEHSTTLGATQLNGVYFGTGQIVDSSLNKRGKIFSSVKSPPSSFGSENSIDTAFNGDLSKVLLNVEHRITGATTAGQPVTGYLYTPEITPHYTYLYNSSGWNQSTTTNIGRTGICSYRTNVFHAGQGDAVAYNANIYCNSTKVGSTSFLANPAVALFNGSASSGADGVYLNPYEIGLADNGFDVAGVGHVINLNRTNTTGAKGAWWCGFRAQSIGSSPIDVGYSAYGSMNIGLDFSFATFQTTGTYNNAAVVMKADQRIYGNANAVDSTGLGRYSSNLSTDYFTYSSGLSAWNFVVGNASVLQLYTSRAGCNRPLAILRAGDGLQVKEGTNAKQGVTSAMVGGSVTTSNTSVTASSRIFFTRNSAGGTLGHLSYSKTAGVGFTITSTSGSETSSFDYQIFEPA